MNHLSSGNVFYCVDQENVSNMVGCQSMRFVTLELFLMSAWFP